MADDVAKRWQANAIREGLTPEQAAEAWAEAERRVAVEAASKNPLGTFAARMAGAGSFGISDWLARKAGQEKPLNAGVEANPTAAFLGNVAGTLAPGMGTAKLAAKATTALGGGAVARIGVNALEGGLYGLGSVVSEESLGDREVTADKLLVGARTGALLGGGLTAVGLGVSKAAQETVKRSAWLADKLDAYANLRATRWLGPTKGELRRNPDVPVPLGEVLHKEGLVGADAATVVARMQELKEETFQKQMGPFLKMGTDKGGFDMAKAVQRIDDEILAPLSKQHDQVDAYNLATAKRDQFAAFGGRVPFEEAARIQSDLGALLRNKEYVGKAKQLMEMRQVLRDEIGGQLDAVVGTGIGAKYAEGVKAYRVMAKGKQWAEGLEAAELKGVTGAIGQGDVTLGILGSLMAGGPSGALAAVPGIAAKAAGGPLGAVALKKAAPTIERLAASFGRFVDRGLASSNTWGGAFRNVLAAASSRSAMDALAAHTKLASNPEYMAELGLTPESPTAALGGVSRMSKLEAAAGIAEQVDAKIDVAINRFFGQQAGRAPAPAMGSPSTRAKDFPKTFALLKEVTEKPEVLAQMLNFPDADSMPGVAAAMGQRYQAAVKHLLDTAPRNPDRSPVEALRQPWKPSEADLQRWYRRVEVVENPLQVLDDVRRGHVTPEAVETFKAVYAPLFQDLQERMMSRLATYEGKLSYRQRAALGQLFPDIGRGLEPAKAALVQGSHQSAMVAPKAPPGGGGDAAKGKAAESRFDNLLTESQRLEKR